MYCWEVEEDNSTGNKWEMSLFDTDTFSGGVKLLCTVKRPFVVFALWHLNIWTVKSLKAFLLKQVSTVHKPGNCLKIREREKMLAALHSIMGQPPIKGEELLSMEPFYS